jgi:hypothetical protein
MANPSSTEHSAVPPTANLYDICFVDKEGRVSLGDSLEYGEETPAPSAVSSLSSRSPTGANEIPALTAVSGPHHPVTTSTASNSSHARTSEGPHPESKSVPVESLIPAEILLQGESAGAKPTDSYFTLM